VQAFCETETTAEAMQSAGLDRRLAKAHLTIKMGGMEAAIETYHSVPTPNVIILETAGSDDILAGLDELATVCDAGTRVVVIGNESDVAPYRELVRRGVSDYSSNDCWRNATTISACSRHRRRSIAFTTLAPMPSMRSSTRCA